MLSLLKSTNVRLISNRQSSLSLPSRPSWVMVWEAVLNFMYRTVPEVTSIHFRNTQPISSLPWTSVLKFRWRILHLTPNSLNTPSKWMLPDVSAQGLQRLMFSVSYPVLSEVTIRQTWTVSPSFTESWYRQIKSIALTRMPWTTCLYEPHPEKWPPSGSLSHWPRYTEPKHWPGSICTTPFR